VRFWVNFRIGAYERLECSKVPNNGSVCALDLQPSHNFLKKTISYLQNLTQKIYLLGWIKE